jgi:hypothetical protein
MTAFVAGVLHEDTGEIRVADVAVHPGEDAGFDRTFGGAMAAYSSKSADAQIGAGPCLYYGYTVTGATATGVIEIRDAVSAGTGTVIDTIAAATAAGTAKSYPYGIYCAAGLYIDFTGTGTVVVHYHQ